MTNDHIPTEEILKDIADTEREIAEMEVEAAHLEQTPLSMRDARWDHMRASSRRSGIEQRHAFIGKLRAILTERAAVHSQYPAGDNANLSPTGDARSTKGNADG